MGTSNMAKRYDLIVVGAGITGTALVYTLVKYTNVKSLALIEKHSKPAQVNSHEHNNSQTLHFGDIETNYNLSRAKEVKRSAEMTKNYLDKFDKEKKIHSVYHKMVLGIGKNEVSQLEKRYKQFKKIFPKLKKLDRGKISKIEPNVVLGRNPEEKILALYSPDGYTVNYEKLAEDFVHRALNEAKLSNKNLDLYFNTELKSIEKSKGEIRLKTNKNIFTAKAVEVATGGYSLYFARSLGLGKNLALVNVAGNFYLCRNLVNGKIYRVQINELPFAAAHGDPEVHDRESSRFGPTAKVLPMLERHNYVSVSDYLRMTGLRIKTIIALISVLSDKVVLKFAFLNVLYDIPHIGKRLFLNEVKKIIPTITPKNFRFAYGYGGIRPQIINIDRRETELGESKLHTDRIIFNITPSPGASVSLGSAEEDAKKLIRFLGREYRFYNKKFEKELVKNGS